MFRYSRVLIVHKLQHEAVNLASMLLDVGATNIISVTNFDEAWRVAVTERDEKRPLHYIFVECGEHLESADFISRIVRDEVLSDAKLVSIVKKGNRAAWAIRLGVSKFISTPFDKQELKQLLENSNGSSKRAV